MQQHHNDSLVWQYSSLVNTTRNSERTSMMMHKEDHSTNDT
jgi:hypothetical protein